VEEKSYIHVTSLSISPAAGATTNAGGNGGSEIKEEQSTLPQVTFPFGSTVVDTQCSSSSDVT